MPLPTQRRPVTVLGAGIVGLATAWLLLQRGHAVRLIDPALNGPPSADAGSWAALGVLMAQVFQRSSGRGWRLRQRSHQLWPQWLEQLAREEAQVHGAGVANETTGNQGLTTAIAPATAMASGVTPTAALHRRRGLLLLAADAAEQEHQQRLIETRARQGIALEAWSQERLGQLQPALPMAALSGLYSAGDGQLDPLAVMAALRRSGERAGLIGDGRRVERIERCSEGAGWWLHGDDGSRLESEQLVLCTGMATAALLEPLGHRLPLEPVLGQAVELELPEPLPGWPGAVVWRGINLVPRPDLPGGRRCWLGATLEPGEQADPEALAALLRWGGDGPAWLQQAAVVRHWQGHRCRPADRAAPVLEQPEPGLLVASGHYRNGVLLAPATAAWVCEQLEREAG